MKERCLPATVSDPHDALADRLRRIAAIDRAGGVLRWDQETYMPPGGTEPRARELSTLATLSHELLTADETGRLIDEADAEASTIDERATVREARWRYERAVRVPDALVEELSETASRAHTAWANAKHEDDFDTFAPYLERIVDLRRRYADAIDPSQPPYEVLFSDHEPWIPWDTARSAIASLREGLADLVDDAPEPSDPDPLPGPFPADDQLALMHDLLEALGYDFDHGRLDQSEHPFSTGNPYDARITTRLHEDDLLSGLTSTVHEFGHALYTQNLPREHLGTPLGASRNLVVHEANSRLWENHVARSLPFWRWLAPILAKRFDVATLDPSAAYRAANQVEPGLIRVDADELTYHLHIALRVEIETALVEGDMTVDEAPERWADRMDALVGVRPDTDREGILQDVHWSHGSIGYFPTYSLGSMLAAQFHQAIEREAGDLSAGIQEGRFGPIRAWLAENVHQHGQRYTTDELIEQATGEPLSAEAFLSYARGKYERVWHEGA